MGANSMVGTSDMSRRGFVAGAAAAAAAACASGAGLSLAKALTTDDVDSWDYECDVLVCGCGTGGCAAAVAAAEAGAEVMVIEKKDWLGGQLRRCGGGVAAAGSQVQKKLGVEDDPESFFEYWQAMQGDLSDPELVKAICDASPSIIDWLIDDLGGEPLDEWEFSEGIEGGLTYSGEPGLNIGTQPENYESVGMEPVARTHWFKPNDDDPIIGQADKVVCPNPGGTGVYKIFSDQFEKYGIEPLTETALVKFITAPGSNEVRGAVASTKDGGEIRIKARKGVVAATGNFCSNHAMFQNYTNYDFTGDDEVNGNGPGIDLASDNDGSGINAVLALGGQLLWPANGVFATEDGSHFGYSFMTGGMKVNKEAEAVDVFGETIPRLYLSSNLSGGQIIKSYHCCGVNLLRFFYLGRTGGTNAAQLDSWE